ncbi:AAA family ATPase [Candidatus Micrarchaeota archaeon]|nr:AAA family ATPase [Candidatus Micrarchaeota archaeon]
MNRVKSGIPGLDELIEGGFPEGSSVLVCGGPGTGKTILCMEYLYNGAKQHGEPGVYVTLEEGAHNLWWNVQRFKWDVQSLERQDKLKIYKFEPTGEFTDLEEQAKRIVDKAKQMGAKRLVIDSLTAFAYWTNDKAKIRYAVYVLIDELRKIKCTSLLTAETRGKKNEFSSFGVEEFLVDGIIALHFVPPRHFLTIRKMRGTDHDASVHPLNFSDKGIGIDAKEKIAWEELKE